MKLSNTKYTTYPFCILISTHEFIMLVMLDVGAMWSFVSCKLAEKLPVTIQDKTHLNVILPMVKNIGDHLGNVYRYDHR